MKRQKSIYATEEEISLDQLMPSFRDEWSGLPAAQAMNAELRATLNAAIATLPELYNSALLPRGQKLDKHLIEGAER